MHLNISPLCTSLIFFFFVCWNMDSFVKQGLLKDAYQPNPKGKRKVNARRTPKHELSTQDPVRVSYAAWYESDGEDPIDAFEKNDDEYFEYNASDGEENSCDDVVSGYMDESSTDAISEISTSSEVCFSSLFKQRNKHAAPRADEVQFTGPQLLFDNSYNDLAAFISSK